MSASFGSFGVAVGTAESPNVARCIAATVRATPATAVWGSSLWRPKILNSENRVLYLSCLKNNILSPYSDGTRRDFKFKEPTSFKLEFVVSLT